MAVNKIIVKDDTLNSLKFHKTIYKISTYDEVISELIRANDSKEKIEKISREDLLYHLSNSSKKLLSRIEALHTRIGYFEKDYFLKIYDIYDAVDERKIKKDQQRNADNSAIEKYKNENEKLKKQLELQIESHAGIEEINANLNKKINLLNSKIVKKSGIFANGFEMNLSEEEYNEIFKN